MAGAAYASAKKVEGLEVKIENLQSALAAQTELLVEMRSVLMPIPVDVMFRTAVRSGGSSAVRRGVGNR